MPNNNPFKEKTLLLGKEVYRLVNYFPDYERFALADQLRRAVASIGSNYSEGLGRATNRDVRNFLSIARGSANEVAYQLEFAVSVGYLSSQQVETALGLCEECSAILTAMMKRFNDGEGRC